MQEKNIPMYWEIFEMSFQDFWGKKAKNVKKYKTLNNF